LLMPDWLLSLPAGTPAYIASQTPETGHCRQWRPPIPTRSPACSPARPLRRPQTSSARPLRLPRRRRAAVAGGFGRRLPAAGPR
jgi:hypothetical protein